MRFAEYDLSKANESVAHAVAEEVLEHGVIVFRNQNLTPDDEVRFCKLIGECQQLQNKPGERGEHIAVNDHIIRVTGEKNQHGEPGLFGHTSALDWHANQASSYDRAPLIWLYGVKETAGSRTSWIDMRQAYEDLSEEQKNALKDIQITLGYETGSYSESDFFVEHHAIDRPFPLVYTNEAGKTGLYFPFLQVFGMVDKSEPEFVATMTWLTAHVLQDKYRYDHDWRDGDVVISEQWLTIHKRWECDNMENRLLHRIAFDYSKVSI